MKGSILHLIAGITLLASPCGEACAQNMLQDSASTTIADTISISKEDHTLLYVDHTHDFRWAQFAVPTCAVIAAAHVNNKNKKLMEVRDWIQERVANPTGVTYTKVDNYLQYVPAAAVYGLNLCGVKGEHNYVDLTILTAMSYSVFAIVNNTLKYTFRFQRPNNGAHNSFPSGHTGTAIAGAEIMRREYWAKSKWIGVGGYLCAWVVGYLRLYNNRHWFNDVLAGAAVGYISTTFAYWLYPKIFRSNEAKQIAKRTAEKRQSISCIGVPYVSTNEVGLTCAIKF